MLSTRRARFVRITGEARGGYIEFQFAIGDPSLTLEMILPPVAFAEFCASNEVVFLSSDTTTEPSRGE